MLCFSVSVYFSALTPINKGLRGQTENEHKFLSKIVVK